MIKQKLDDKIFSRMEMISRKIVSKCQGLIKRKVLTYQQKRAEEQEFKRELYRITRQTKKEALQDAIIHKAIHKPRKYLNFSQRLKISLESTINQIGPVLTKGTNHLAQYQKQSGVLSKSHFHCFDIVSGSFYIKKRNYHKQRQINLPSKNFHQYQEQDLTYQLTHVFFYKDGQGKAMISRKKHKMKCYN